MDGDAQPFHFTGRSSPLPLMYFSLPPTHASHPTPEADFRQIDAYARNVKQRGPYLTPDVLVKKFLVRPYRHDLHKVRAIFAWIVDNIGVGRPLEAGSAAAAEPEGEWVETAEAVLQRRWCRSGVGVARLFCEMAVAAGVEDTRVVYGFLRGEEWFQTSFSFCDGFLFRILTPRTERYNGHGRVAERKDQDESCLERW
ncbi:hypothetical protein BC936DRAFT_138324 [Jimgerdemannia flammicorona]|uniref:Transglutaminase-like domain-containing protein n=1 Tax=Jimgerdemannia flammicorona TaxID=994334 RepID=A0A433CPL1_9FUNG|nr:hypothetical protein BC936DRAFT_138324 [Jimgerdemannia flammicorona]